MINEHFHQDSCRHAENLVSYLYDEISGAEKLRFEEHLVSCSSCAEELTDFSLVRSSIIDWRDTEFEPLKAPLIQIPVQKAVLNPVVTDSNSLAARVRALFSLSPAWTGAAALTALVICIGLIFSVSNFQSNPETARIDNETKIETNPPLKTEDKTDLPFSAKEIAGDNVSEKSSKPSKAINTDEKPVQEKNSKLAAKSELRDVANTKNQNNLSAKTVKSSKSISRKPAQSPPPTLMAEEDEYEDNSLRLSDVFRGIGGK